MPDRNQAALDCLLSRRSRPQKTLVDPVPDRAALEPILSAALRTPDHGKLEPWRLMVLDRAALAKLASATATKAGVRNRDKPGRLLSQNQPKWRFFHHKLVSL